MEITKPCLTCGKQKPLDSFFTSSIGDRAASRGTSKHCKACHDDGLVKYGYGWPGFGGLFKTPEESVA